MSLAMILTAAALEAALVVSQSEKPADELAFAREQERVARLELEAAKSKEFYLLADVGASTLSLNLSGVTLASFHLDAVDLGLPVSTTEASGQELSPLFPCRAPMLRSATKIEPGQSADVATPPAPEGAQAEEEKPKIDRVTLDCEPSLAVHLVSSSSVGVVESLRDRIRLPGERKVELRVRLLVADSDAGRLFLSLPPDVLLLFSLTPAKPASSAPR